MRLAKVVWNSSAILVGIGSGPTPSPPQKYIWQMTEEIVETTIRIEGKKATPPRKWCSSTVARKWSKVGAVSVSARLIVAGDHKGRVGYGFGKANEVSEAIRKASESARKSMVAVAVHENTIPHEVIGEFGGGRVLLRPASPGTGVIAGGGVRAVVEAAGIKDVLAKSLGSSNHANVVKATIEALQRTPAPPGYSQASRHGDR